MDENSFTSASPQPQVSQVPAPQVLESASATTGQTKSGPTVYILFVLLCALAMYLSTLAGGCAARFTGWAYDNTNWDEYGRLREEFEEALDSYGDISAESLDEVRTFIR